MRETREGKTRSGASLGVRVRGERGTEVPRARRSSEATIEPSRARNSGVRRPAPSAVAVRRSRPDVREPATGDFRPPLAFLVVVILLLAGCQPTNPVLVETYGKATGDGKQSVAGTSALVEMFRDAGFEVRTGESLGRHLDRAQTIVWTPDNDDLPSEEVCDYFDKWLSVKPGRTLVYVGRDYDAVYDYWSDMADRLKGAEKIKALRKKAQRSYEMTYLRTSREFDRDHRWFVQKDAPVVSRVRKLSAPPWSGWTNGVDESKTKIRLQSTLGYPPPDEEDEAALNRARTLSYEYDFDYAEEFGYEDEYGYDGEYGYDYDPMMYNESFEKGYDDSLVRLDPIVLLEADGRPMVSSAQWGGGENPSALVVVSNGSFLLNYPLTNQENRKLAGKLIDECGPPGLVYFLSSGPGEIEIRDPRDPKRTAWTMFTEWPLGIFMIHLTIAGLIVCLAAFPIFGRPRSYVTRDLQDFGYHLEAVGRLLERRKAYDFARQRLAAYSERLRRETGSRLRKAAEGALPPTAGPEPPSG